MNRESEYVQVRVRREVGMRLREFARRVLKSVETGRVDGELHHHGHVSLSVAIGILLDREERHRERSAKTRKRD